MNFAALLLLLLPGCTMAVAGDAHDACERITNVLRDQAARCPGSIAAPSTAPGFCGRAWIIDATSEQATECEVWASTVACKDIDATYSPSCDFTRYP